MSISEQTEQAPVGEQPGNWYFTFGHGQQHGPNGYVVIHGTFALAREEMFRRYGPKWSMQYTEAKALPMIAEWNMTEVK